MHRENYLVRSFVNCIEIIRQSQLHFSFFQNLVYVTKSFGWLSHLQVIQYILNTWEDISNIKYYEKKDINLRKRQ